MLCMAAMGRPGTVTALEPVTSLTSTGKRWENNGKYGKMWANNLDKTLMIWENDGNMMINIDIIDQPFDLGQTHPFLSGGFNIEEKHPGVEKDT